MPKPVEYGPGTPFPGVVGRTVEESVPAWPAIPRAPAGAPNVVVFALDDARFAQLSPFGGRCGMPALHAMSSRGLRYSNFHATPLCSPTRACLLTGRNHHTVGMASLSELSLGYPHHNSTTDPKYAVLPATLRQARIHHVRRRQMASGRPGRVVGMPTENGCWPNRSLKASCPRTRC